MAKNKPSNNDAPFQNFKRLVSMPIPRPFTPGATVPPKPSKPTKDGK